MCRISKPLWPSGIPGRPGTLYGGQHRQMAVTLGDGTDAAIVVYGDLVNEALSAAERLSKKGVSVRVVKLNVINPLIWRWVREAISPCRGFLAAEESAPRAVWAWISGLCGGCRAGQPGQRHRAPGTGAGPPAQAGAGRGPVWRQSDGIDRRGYEWERSGWTSSCLTGPHKQPGRRAKTTIMSGVVYVAGQKADKPGMPVRPTSAGGDPRGDAALCLPVRN